VLGEQAVNAVVDLLQARFKRAAGVGLITPLATTTASFGPGSMSP